MNAVAGGGTLLPSGAAPPQGTRAPLATLRPHPLSRFKLSLLGRLLLEGDSSELDTLLARRRLLALLAVVGASGKRGVSRDALLLYFWPESTAAKARNSLNQALHALRRTLGRDAVSGTHELRLDPSVIACDYAEFIAAAEDHDYERVASLRRGRLLEDFTLPNAPEWESWLAQERAREARVYCHAIEQIARKVEQSGDLQGAAQWWARLADMEPLSSRAVSHAIRALAAAGDRSGAIARGDRYVRDVRDEIEADPDLSVTQLMDRIRRVTPRAVPALADTDDEESDSAEVPVFEVVARNLGDRAVSGEAAAGPRRYFQLALTALAVLTLAVTGLVWRSRAGAESAATAPLVIIQTVALSGAGPADGAALAGLMAAAIDGVLGVRAVVANSDGDKEDSSPSARAYRVVTELVRQGTGTIRGSAVVLDGDRGRPIAWATSTNDAGDVFGIVDDLTRQVLLNVAARELGLHSSAVVTPDLAALQAYLDGEGRLRNGQNAAAMEAFRRATALDTNFAYAFYRLGTAAELMGRDKLARESFDAAARNASLLPPFERTMIAAARALQGNHRFEAERLYREAVVEYPDAIDAWRELAWSTFYNSPLRGRPVTDAQPALRRVLELSPNDPEALIYLARIASLEGRARDAAALNRRIASAGVVTIENRAFRFLALADPFGVKRVTHALLGAPSRLLDSIAVTSIVDPGPAGVERLARVLAAPEQPRDARGFGYRLLAQSQLARGRTRAAMISLDSAAAVDTAMALEVRGLYVATAALAYGANDVSATRAALERWDSSNETDSTVHSEAHRGLHGAMRDYLLGRLALRAGDQRAANRHLAALAASRVNPRMAPRVATLTSSLRAHIAFAGGRWQQALSELEKADWPSSANVFIAEAGDRFLKAELFERLGRVEEARAWYESLAQRTSYEMVYLGIAEYRLAKIAEAAGDRRRSVRHYGRVRELYAGGDSQLAQLAVEATLKLP